MWHVCPRLNVHVRYIKTINRFLNGVDHLWTSTVPGTELYCTGTMHRIVSCVFENPVWFCGIELRLCKAILMKVVLGRLVNRAHGS
jgi:hypothetical protein